MILLYFCAVMPIISMSVVFHALDKVDNFYINQKLKGITDINDRLYAFIEVRNELVATSIIRMIIAVIAVLELCVVQVWYMLHN